MSQAHRFKLFDAHMHIIDKRFPLIENQGYLPDAFSCEDYLQRTKSYDLAGGVVVSGSFQGFDQTYLIDALNRLGSNFVGVTQLPPGVSDEALISLNEHGVRGLRFNLKRGGSADIKHLETMARRVHDLVGWHVELYIDARDLDELEGLLLTLPGVSIDHLGLYTDGLSTLLRLAESGVRVKATGFSRGDLDIPSTLHALHQANPTCLMFGTDLPSTRAPRPYSDIDLMLVIDTLGVGASKLVCYDNAVEFYRL